MVLSQCHIHTHHNMHHIHYHHYQYMYLITLSVALAESKSVSDSSGASQTAACNIAQAMFLCRDIRSVSSWGRLPVNDH